MSPAELGEASEVSEASTAAELPPLPDLAQFHCLRLTGCQRCKHRREAAQMRVGSSSPCRTHVERPSPMRPPPSPAAPRRSPSAPSRRPAQPAPEHEEPCQQMAKLLAQFTKRVQSFFMTLMGFNHPHMERLHMALQQQVQILASGLMDLMTKHSAFLSLRSAMREGKLWERFRQRHQALFQRGEELKACSSALEEAQQTLALRKRSELRLERRCLSVAELGGRKELKAGLCAIFQRWHHFAHGRLQGRRAACRAQQMGCPSREAFLLQSAFVQWHRVRSAALQLKAAAQVAKVPVCTTPMVELSRVRRYVEQATARQRHTGAATLVAWRFVVARSQNRCWQERSEDMCQSMRSSLRQNNLKFWIRLGDANARLALKAALMRWRAGTAYSAAERWSRSAGVRVACNSCQILQRLREVSCARICLAHWNKWAAGKPPGERRRQAVDFDLSQDLHFPLRAREDGGSASSFARAVPAPSFQCPVRAPVAPVEAHGPPSDAWNAQLASHFNATYHQDQVMKHWSLATEASQSEEGYLKLLEYHRERRRRERRR